MINVSTLCVIFVSSEGSIIPEIQNSSMMNGCARMQEIGDISNEKAVKYLCDNEVTDHATKKLVNTLGGRFVYLKKPTGSIVSLLMLHQ